MDLLIILTFIVLIFIFFTIFNNSSLQIETHEVVLSSYDLGKEIIIKDKKYNILKNAQVGDIIVCNTSKHEHIKVVAMIHTQILKKIVDQIKTLDNTKRYTCFSELDSILGKNHSVFQDIQSISSYIFTEPSKNIINDFLQTFEEAEKRRQTNNEIYVAESLKQYKAFFDKLEKYPLEEKQRLAILHDEDNNLVVAGAGTGKTTTIAGKACFLIDKQKVNPGKILLLAFTKKAVDEMKDRLGKLLNNNSESFLNQLMIKTFHSFGLYITRNTDGKSDVLEETEAYNILEEEFEKLCNNGEFLRILNEYFLYYMRSIPKESDFPTKDQYYKFLKKTLITLNGIIVKSHEELQVANFLFMSGIKFEYEKDYKIITKSLDHRQYKPDFYLPDYDIYIEHFGINKNNTSPFGHKYIVEMEWKLRTHLLNNTKLIETYSYENQDGVLISNLIQKLKTKGVKLKDLDHKEIFEKIKQQGNGKIIHGFTKLLHSFLNLFKGSSKKFEELYDLIPNDHNKIRTLKFLEIFKVVYNNYENYLKKNNVIDFNDMIINAISYIENGKFNVFFDYILVDEFQDISLARYKLLKAIKDKTTVKTFCVGDDWQSIYRFSGSRIDIFTQFEQYFGFTHETFLDKTYRFNKGICDISTKFITKNPKQLQKDLVTLDNNTKGVLTFFSKSDNPNKDLYDIVNNIIQIEGKENNVKIFVLIRYNFLRDSYTKLRGLREHFPNVDIEVLTDHISKGKEADYVIIDFLDTSNKPGDFYGFPSDIEDDVIMDILLDNTDSYFHAEERRLFYVAFTRARKKVYLLASPGKESIFYEELIHEDSENHTINKVLCSKCGGEMLVRKNKKGDEFYGCSNYPFCKEIKRKRNPINDKSIPQISIDGFSDSELNKVKEVYNKWGKVNSQYKNLKDDKKWIDWCGELKEEMGKVLNNTANRKYKNFKDFEIAFKNRYAYTRK